MMNPLSKDLDFILEHTLPEWEAFRNQKIFITGGTGFFGSWLLESFVWANNALNLNAQATVLTRDVSAFSKKCPRLFQSDFLHFHQGDVRNFTFPKQNFSFVIHAATEASVSLNESNPVLMFDTITLGTTHLLDFAKSCAAQKVLFISSGAVYGKQPSAISHLSEEYCHIAPSNDNPKSTYAIGKYAAEHLCSLYAHQYGLDIKIARCFAFVGPYLPLDGYFAIGNFIRDGLNGNTIMINGDGTSFRSYLYAADLMIWLWTILWRGKSLRPYNVGSDQAFAISDVAHLVANAFEPKITVNIAKTPQENLLPEKYVPDTTRAQNELGLKQRINLKEAIKKHIDWQRHFLPSKSRKD